MSIILDALRKSDAARPENGQQRLAPGPMQRRGPPGWLWLLLGLATVAVCSAALTAYLSAPDRAASRETDSKERIMENGSADVRPLAMVASERSEPQSVRQAAQQEANTASATSDGKDEPADAAQSEAAPDMGRASQNGKDAEDELVAPWLKDMPADYRINVPGLTVNALAYAENPAERFVLINLRRYAEGERLQEGPRVLQIQSGAVILEYMNRIFALPAR